MNKIRVIPFVEWYSNGKEKEGPSVTFYNIEDAFEYLEDLKKHYFKKYGENYLPDKKSNDSFSVGIFMAPCNLIETNFKMNIEMKFKNFDELFTVKNFIIENYSFLEKQYIGDK